MQKQHFLMSTWLLIARDIVLTSQLHLLLSERQNCTTYGTPRKVKRLPLRSHLQLLDRGQAWRRGGDGQQVRGDTVGDGLHLCGGKRRATRRRRAREPRQLSQQHRRHVGNTLHQTDLEVLLAFSRNPHVLMQRLTLREDRQRDIDSAAALLCLLAQ